MHLPALQTTLGLEVDRRVFSANNSVADRRVEMARSKFVRQTSGLAADVMLSGPIDLSEAERNRRDALLGCGRQRDTANGR